ncbi:MAG: hypothetical protein B7Y65_00575 [Azorhizobium sp. 35-67-15]|nr:MAG: hypothetical protein B7Y65_00575 [Azorhizobium sp. 35-67-15]
MRRKIEAARRRRNWLFPLLLPLVAAALANGAAFGQAMPFAGASPAPPPIDAFSAPPALGTNPGLRTTPQGQAPSREPHAVLPPAPAGKTTVGVFARFSADGPAIPHGLMWRVFADTPEASGAFPLVAESTDPAPVFFLNPGGYIVHVTYGFSTAAQRLQVGAVARREQFVLPAGGLRLEADVESKIIPGQKLTFDIYEGSFLQGRTSTQPYYRGANAGDVVLLPEGTYHVVSTYGDANAVVRADVNVQAGKLTDATFHHRAAQIVLKLVAEKGGDAQANTQWSVVTPGGDTIKESIGALPTVVLSEGDYTAIARNDGKVISRDFKVEAGKDREVEVINK